MNNREINRQIQALESLIKKASKHASDDIELQSHWARYICVLSAGLLENSIYEIYSDFVSKASSRPVANFASRTLSKIQNPNANKFVEIVNSFNNAWAEELTTYLNEEGRREAINSIITNRHKIAHGKQSDISLARIEEYLQKSIQVLSFIESQVLK